MLVLDSSVVVVSCAVEDGFTQFGDEELVAPTLMWSEAASAIHEAVFRKEIPPELGRQAYTRLERSPVRRRDHRRLRQTAWQLADDFGWAKTYDAEYVALAQLLGCRLVTLDRRLRRGTDRLGIVVGPEEL